MRSIPSFTRLLRILLRVLNFMERTTDLSQRLRVTIFEAFLMSWSVDPGLSLECISVSKVDARLEWILRVRDEYPTRRSQVRNSQT
jgi:hypothetical protein